MLANALIFSNYNKLGLKLPKMPNFLEKREKRKERDIKRSFPHAKYRKIS
jgi:hypothetical protein